jgi:hypothetical protein
MTDKERIEQVLNDKAHMIDIAAGEADTFTDGSNVDHLASITTEELAAEIARRNFSCVVAWHNKATHILTEEDVDDKTRHLVGREMTFPNLSGLVFCCAPQHVRGLLTQLADKCYTNAMGLEAAIESGVADENQTGVIENGDGTLAVVRSRSSEDFPDRT